MTHSLQATSHNSKRLLFPYLPATERLDCLLISGITGIASALAIAAMRCIAEAQIVPIESVFWGANLATGVVFGVTIFVAVFGALCLAFFEAKQRRAKIEAELDCPDDL